MLLAFYFGGIDERLSYGFRVLYFIDSSRLLGVLPVKEGI